MQPQPLVSVVLIFYNAQAFLDETVRSVFAQEYKDWELILVDDGSTDQSTAMARQLANDNPDRVRCLQHPSHTNRGASASRNLGVREARGQFIALLDADDVWLPHKLAQQVQILEQNPRAA